VHAEGGRILMRSLVGRVLALEELGDGEAAGAEDWRDLAREEEWDGAGLGA
jgi:hypothetical protein